MENYEKNDEMLFYYTNDREQLTKDIKTFENSVSMLQTTKDEMSKKGADEETITLVIKEIEEVKEKLSVLKDIEKILNIEDDNIMKIKVTNVDRELIEKIHNIESKNMESHEKNMLSLDEVIVLENWSSVNSFLKNGYEKTYSARNPVLNYCFLVKLPDILDIKSNEITGFRYMLPYRTNGLFKRLRKYGDVDVTFRESVGSNQMMELVKNTGKNIYGEIRLITTDRCGKYQHTLVFSDLILKEYRDFGYTYSNEDSHVLCLHFKFRKIEYIDKTADEATTKEQYEKIK